jgi:hypothetical protein
VGVDDPRHEGATRRVENLRLPVDGDLGFGADGDDRGVLHYHDRAFQRIPSAAVDERDSSDGEPFAHGFLSRIR